MKKTLKRAAGAAIVAGAGFAATAAADNNPFSANLLANGYQLAQADTKTKDGKCGEAKCGAEAKAVKAKDGKCGEAKCGAEKKSAKKPAKKTEAKPAADKAAEGKCGEGKCGSMK